MDNFSWNQKICLTVIEGFSVFMTVFLTQMITTVFPAYPSVMVAAPPNQSLGAIGGGGSSNCSVDDPDNVYVSILIGAKYCTEIVIFPIAGWILDKYHPPLVLLCGALVEALVCVVYSASGNFYSTMFARSLDAIGYAVVSTSGLTIVYSLFGTERARNKVITIDSVLVYISASVSPYIAGSIYEHFAHYNEHASRIAAFMWVLPLFLLLAVAIVPFAFPCSWVSQMVLGGHVTELCAQCWCRAPRSELGKPYKDCSSIPNGRMLVTEKSLNRSNELLQITDCVLLNNMGTGSVSLMQHDPECVPLVQHDSESVPLMQQDTECVPLMQQDTESVPLMQENIESVLLAQQGAECVSLVQQGTESVPIMQHDSESVPPFQHDPESVLLIQQDSESVPLVQQDSESVPLVQQDSESVPLIRQGTESVPLIQHDSESVPLIRQGTESVPLVQKGTECVSLVQHDTESVPLIQQGTESMSLVQQSPDCVLITMSDASCVPLEQHAQECVSSLMEHEETPPACPVVTVSVPVTMPLLLKDPHVLVALGALLFNSLTNNSLETTLPIFMIRKFCASQQQQGAVFLFGFLSILGFSGSSLLFHRRPQICWCLPLFGMLVSGGLCVSLAFCAPWWTIGVCVGLLSFSSAITEVILVPLIPKIIDVKYAESYGSASGLTMLTFTVSGLIGTFPVGALVQHCGFLTLCCLLCAINCACAPFIVLLRRFFT